MKMNKKIIILDFDTGEVHVYETNKSQEEQFIEDINEKYGTHFRASNVEYMVVEELKITIH